MSHNFNGTEINDKINISGNYDVNIWYSYDNDTKTTVLNKKIDYNETVSVNQKETTDTNTKDIIIRSLKQPSVSNAIVKDNKIEIEVEKELGIEIVGDTKFKISVEEDDEPWDTIIEEEYNDNVSKEIDENIKEDYIDNN